VDAVIDNLPTYLNGFGTTVLLLVVSGLAALVIGTIVAAMRISPVATLRVVATVYTEIVRNTPLTLVLIFCASFGGVTVEIPPCACRDSNLGP
jgi:glutamate transport system permease protein